MVGRVVTDLDGRINGMAVRVPVSDVSTIDLTARLRDKASCEGICAAVREQSAADLKGVLARCDEPVVSTDFRGSSHCSILDALAGMLIECGLTRLIAWYDNEWDMPAAVSFWQYSSRLLGSFWPCFKVRSADNSLFWPKSILRKQLYINLGKAPLEDTNLASPAGK